MTDARPDVTQLNAYIDGELSAKDAAAVARAIANDRALADLVARLSRLKAATQEALAEERLTLSAPPAPRRAWRPALAVAAALLLFVAAGFAVDQIARPGAPPWLDQAWKLHRAWAANDQAPDPAIESGVLLAGLTRLGPDALVPDLSAARLTIARLTIESGPDGRIAAHAGYRGNRGCHISLFILAAVAGLPTDLTPYDAADAHAYGWRVGGSGYLLLNEGMPSGRFGLIARSVHDATQKHAPLDAKTRTALARSRSASPPCMS